MATEISIRRALPGDGEALAVVGQATFLETFSGILDGSAIVEHCRDAHSVAQYNDWLSGSAFALWLAEALPGNAPVGYAVVGAPDLPQADRSRDLELKRIYLLSRFHGGGTGRRMLEVAIEHATLAGAARLLLGVFAGNTAAMGFYKRHGFTLLTQRQFKVGGRAYDDTVMSRTLGP